MDGFVMCKYFCPDSFQYLIYRGGLKRSLKKLSIASVTKNTSDNTSIIAYVIATVEMMVSNEGMSTITTSLKRSTTKLVAAIVKKSTPSIVASKDTQPYLKKLSIASVTKNTSDNTFISIRFTLTNFNVNILSPHH